MSRHIPASLRDLVTKRAKRICEYCLAFEGHSYVKFQMEHIISLKHGGKTEADNLALSCFYCNNAKGTDLGIILGDGTFTRFYHPRNDNWRDHFELENHLFVPKTKIGEGTIKILTLNHEERLVERLAFLEIGQFPHPNALSIIRK
jgi:hypothetical protein